MASDWSPQCIYEGGITEASLTEVLLGIDYLVRFVEDGVASEWAD